MNDDDPHSTPDPNPYWDHVEPECRWVPQCRRLLTPGACDECKALNPNPDLAWYEDAES